ncbi:MAG: GatB/Yqey domain-containing protein [Microgenomates bacterium 39_7]|nr:MAG: GatB/Yqey domain-containing protein [Microgenomates bacterium 39_7]
MSLKKQLIEDMKQAMRNKDALKLDVIRLLRAQIQNVEINEGELTNEQIEQLVSRAVKQWQDAIQDYKRGDRQDLVEEAQQKIDILQEYLPQQLTDEQLLGLIKKVKQETGLDKIGPIIGKVKQQVGNQADGSRIAKLVSQVMN